MSDDETTEKTRLQVCLDARKLEIELFWRRALFFWLFIAAAFVAFASAYPRQPGLAIVVACFGGVASLAWTLANRGSKYWQETWEARVEESEDAVVGPLFKRDEPVQSHKLAWFRARRYSVSKLAIAVSDYVLILWLGVLLRELFHYVAKAALIAKTESLDVIAFAAFTLIYLIMLLFAGRSSSRVNAQQDAPADATTPRG